MGFDVSEAAANAVLYCILILFTILALGSAGWFSNILPHALTKCCLLSSNQDDNIEQTPDYFLSARNSAGTMAIALSFFASGMGAWVLYGTTEMGANPALSWLGVIGYSSASAFPAILIGGWLGPQIRALSPKKAFSTTDFGRQRYGRIMQISMACISGFYMFIFIVAELTSISSIFATLTNNWETIYGVGITVSIGILTILYTTIAGLPASIVTDKFQGIIMAMLVLLLTIAVTANPNNKVSRDEFAKASNWTKDGFIAAVTLVIAIACAELFNQGTWQRVWAAESIPSMRKGFFIGSVMVFFLMMFFGIMGMIAYAKDPEAYDSYEKLSFLAFFDLLEPLASGWQILTLIMVTALAASSIDSLQNGIASVFAHDLVQVGWNPKFVSRVLLVLVNIPAIYLASKAFDVIALFLVADLVCATSVFPVFLGLQRKDYGPLKAPTELGAFLGILSGMATVLVNGAINDAEGGLFEYFWLRNGAMCALCGTQTMVSFIVTPLVSAAMTYICSFLDVAIRGDRAREPIWKVAFDEGDELANVPAGEQGENDSNEKADSLEDGNSVDEKDSKQDGGEVALDA